LPSWIVFSRRRFIYGLHALCSRHDECKHRASGVQPVQPRWLLSVDWSVCSQWLVSHGHLLFGRSIIFHVHPVRPWHVLRQFRAWLCVWPVSSRLLLQWWCCLCRLCGMPSWNTAKSHWAGSMRAVLRRHVLCSGWPQRPYRPLQRWVAFPRRRHQYGLHQV
jgi:hypothetical protein